VTDLGTALTILRIVRGWNQVELAKACGIRAGTISDYETGKMVPGFTTAKKMLSAQGYSWEALDMALNCMLRLRAGSQESSSSTGKNGDKQSLQSEIEDIAANAGSVVSRIVRLLFNGPLSNGRGNCDGEEGTSE
jgi:transcriptional regulator with XRE-family HTH domain